MNVSRFYGNGLIFAALNYATPSHDRCVDPTAAVPAGSGAVVAA